VGEYLGLVYQPMERVVAEGLAD